MSFLWASSTEVPSRPKTGTGNPSSSTSSPVSCRRRITASSAPDEFGNCRRSSPMPAFSEARLKARISRAPWADASS